MKAVSINGYGGLDVLNYGEAPQPKLDHDDVLIRVHAAAVNPVDVALRQGYMAEWVSPTFPYILGCDVSGTIEAVGPDANGFKIGEEVFARSNISRDGSYAEYIAVDAKEVLRKPQSLDHVHAAAAPHASLTAWISLFTTAGLSAGQTVLIHGAAGGVGHMAVQLAKWRGARVIATASSYNHDFLSQLGADEIIDYNKTQFEAVAQQVDVVFDTIGGDTQERSWATLKPGGMLVSVVQPPSNERADALGVRASMVGAYPDPAILAEVVSLVNAGKLKPYVSKVFPLSEARKAQEMIGSRHTRGKIVLQVMQ
jgi:NADPH:quinone reductase-like Zn-dependent oxidoreductase